MESSLKRIVSKITAFWKKTSKKAKGLLIGSAVLLVLLVVVLEVAVNHVSYTLLYSGLSDSDAGQIVTQLKSMNVRYRLNGTSIYVDRSKADETRMVLAEDGYPQSKLNYSVYTSGTSWATTDSDKKRMALYQTQNRLQDTIDTISGVKSSVVTIGESDDTTYVLESDKVPVTASVKLTLQNGTELTKKQVNGIVQLVAHSVSDLSADNVTLLDSDGNDLSAADDSLDGATSDQLALQSEVENEVRRKVLSVLTPIFGSGNVAAAAGATLDFSQRTTSSVTYASPNSGSTVGLPSAQSGATTVSGGASGTGASGVAGVNNGTPAYTTTGSSAASGAAVTQSNSQASYLYNTVNEQIQSKGASLKSLTVSVQINNKSQAAANVNVDDIRQAVAYAVGMTDPTNVSVQMLPFATSSGSAASTAKTAGWTPSTQVILIGAGVGVLLLATGVLLLILRRRRRRKEEAEAQAAARLKTAQAVKVVQPSPDKTLEEKIEESNKNELKKQIDDFTDQKPELVAQLLKNWLKD